MPDPAKGQHLREWKSIRRVDHHSFKILGIGKEFHPRKRQYRNATRHLKGGGLDMLVGKWDEVDNFSRDSYNAKKNEYLYILGRIIELTTALVSDVSIEDRYKPPARTLRTWARNAIENVNIYGGNYNANRGNFKNEALAEIDAFIAGTPLPRKNMNVTVYLVVPSANEPPFYIPHANREITKHKDETQDIFDNANINITFSNTIRINENVAHQHLTTPHFDDPAIQQGERRWPHENGFSPQRAGDAAIDELIRRNLPTPLVNKIGTSRGIAAVFVPRFDSSSCGGFTYRRQKKASNSSARRYFEVPRPIIVVPINSPLLTPQDRDRRRPLIYTTVAHELGHAMTGRGFHVEMGVGMDNLMAPGNVRSGALLDLGLISVLRNNPATSNIDWPATGYFEAK